MKKTDSTAAVPSLSPQGKPSTGLALSPASFSDPKTREKLRHELRAEEWALHLELIEAARFILKTIYENPHKHTMADLARIADLASRLGRLATEASDGFPAPDLDSGTVMIQFEAALKTVFARRIAEKRPIPVEVVVEAQPPTQEINSAAQLNPQDL